MHYTYIYVHKETQEKIGWQEFDKLTPAEQEQYSEVCRIIESPYERTRAAVYATGNKWAIENFNATH